MKCCSECFENPNIQSYIKSMSDEVGTCDFCKSHDTALLNTNDLFDFVRPLLELYKGSLHEEFGEHYLSEELRVKWHLFSEKLNGKEKLLVDEIIPESDEWAHLKHLKVFIGFETDPNLNPLIERWESFRDEIMYQNRFFFQSFKSRQLEEILNYEELERFIDGGTKLYRGRLCYTDSPIAPNDMGKPDIKFTSPGRANPVGIPYLYVSTEPETVIYEVRATHYDTVTIGTFKAKEQLRILNIRSMDIYGYDPFSFEDDLAETLQAMLFLSTLKDELSKPMRRTDSELDYLPTQYICEFAKQLGFDGIQYASTLNHGGTNLAIFNDEKLDCTKTENYFVNKIDIDYQLH